jgi:hypothetical protein
MPRVTKLLGRRVGPLGIALTAYDIWRRLPESQRRRLLEQGRKHGPRIAAEAVRRGAKLRKR